MLYGTFFALFIGTVTSLTLPGVGSITLGAASGAAVGWATYLLLGTLGIATGGAAIALGALGMALIGSLLGAVGGASGGFGLSKSIHFFVTPWFWAPLIIIGIFIALRGNKKDV